MTRRNRTPSRLPFRHLRLSWGFSTRGYCCDGTESPMDSSHRELFGGSRVSQRYLTQDTQRNMMRSLTSMCLAQFLGSFAADTGTRCPSPG